MMASVSLPLLQGLNSRKGAPETLVAEALQRHLAARRIGCWASRCVQRRSRPQPPARRPRQPKRRKLHHSNEDTAPASSTTTTMVPRQHNDSSSSASWQHWTFQELLSPSLQARQMALCILLKGTTTAQQRWQLRQVLVSLASSSSSSLSSHSAGGPEFLQLFGLLTHLVCEQEPQDMVAFVASGGLRWVTRSILHLVVANNNNSTSTTHASSYSLSSTAAALQTQIFCFVDLCYRLVLFSEIVAKEEPSTKKRRRPTIVDEEHRKALVKQRLATLHRLHQLLWMPSPPSLYAVEPLPPTSLDSLSPLACLICVYHVLRKQDVGGGSGNTMMDSCMAMLARLVDPTAEAYVAPMETKGEPLVLEHARPTSAASTAMARAVSAAMDALDPNREEDDDGHDDDVVMEDVHDEGDVVVHGETDDDDNEDEDDDATEEEEEEVEFSADEEEGQDDDDDEEIESQGGDDDGEEEGEEAEDDDAGDAEDDDDVVDVVRDFEQRLIDINDDVLLSEGDDGFLTEGAGESATSSVSLLTESNRKRAYVQESMEVLAVHHPALQMTQGQGAILGKSEYNPLLNPAAEQSLLNSVCHIVKPPRKPLNLKIFMRRAPTQEEFFRGSLSRNPVSLSSLTPTTSTSANGVNEPTVRNLRQHIADDLQMSDSAELIELLVANKILDINLNLRVVQQVLWKNHLMENSTSGFASSLLAGQSATSFFSTGSGLSMIFSSGLGDRGTSSRNITADTPVSSLPPMVVTYRLAGVDGEATEDHVDSLEDPEAPSSSSSPEEQDRLMEREYGITRLVTAGRGINILVRSIESHISDTLRRIRRDDVVAFNARGERIGPNPARVKFQQSPPCAGLVLLRHCSKLASNRKKLLEARAPTALLRLLLDVLNAMDESQSTNREISDENPGGKASNVANPTADLLEELIETLASDISTEADQSLSIALANVKAGTQYGEDSADQDASTLPLLLSSLRTIYLGPPLRKAVAKLLPFLTYGQVALSRELASHFVSHVDVKSLADLEDSDKLTTRALILMSTFVQAAISLPPSEVCNTLRAELMKCGFVEQIASFVLQDMPSQPPPWSSALWSKSDKIGSKQGSALEKSWRAFFQRRGLRTAFQMLAGLCSGHVSTQSMIADVGSESTETGQGIATFLKACHWMESTSDSASLDITTNGIGLLAETLLDELADGNDDVSNKVSELRKKARDRKKEIAEERRSKALVSMSAFGPLAGSAAADQNSEQGVVAAASLDVRSQSAVGMVEDVARRVGASTLLAPVLGFFRDQGGNATSVASSSNTASRVHNTESKEGKGAKKLDPNQPSWLAEMEAMEDESGLTCAVCQEGRTLQPSELLGLYTFVKKVNIPFNRGGGRGHIDGTLLLVSLPSSLPESLVNTNVDHEWFRPARSAADAVRSTPHATSTMLSSAAQSRKPTQLITTVSAGNAIHCSCHAKARSADRNHPRAPKSEWEGASLRNSRVSCNAILPLVSSKSSKVSLVAVDMALTDHQTVITNLLGTRPKSMLWTVLHDIRLLLLRMAHGEALNADCGGGSLSSNASLLFYQLFMADMFTNDADHDSPETAQHVRFLSAAFLAACHILQADDFDATGSSTTATLARGIADAAPMASLCCILFHNASDEDLTVPDKGCTPHPRRRWAMHKEDFLRGLITCGGRRHALSVDDSGCLAPQRGSRVATRTIRSSSFTDWDLASDDIVSPAGASASSRRKHPSSILGKRGLPQMDDFALALRPMITLYAILDQLSSDFVVTMNDEAVAESAARLTHTIEACQKSKSIYDLLQKAKVTLDHEAIIEELQKGMTSA